jgi:hypothetical protein
MGNQGSPLPPPFYNLFEKKTNYIILIIIFIIIIFIINQHARFLHTLLFSLFLKDYTFYNRRSIYKDYYILK